MEKTTETPLFILAFPDEMPVLDMYAHAFDEYPASCVGIILGERKTTSDGVDLWRVSQLLRADNVAPEKANDCYDIEPQVLEAVKEKARGTGLSVLGFYHSHTTEKLGFSQTDLEHTEEFRAGEPWVPARYVYCVVSVCDRKTAGFAAYRVDKGQYSEVGTYQEDDD